MRHNDFDAFDEFLIAHGMGRRLHLTKLKQSEATVYERIHEFAFDILEIMGAASNDLQVDIKLGFCDSQTFNAAAFRVGNERFISINSGLIRLLYYVYYTFLSDPDVFSEIGDVSQESGTIPLLDIFGPSGAVLITSDNWSMPKDTRRYEYANFLFKVGISFVIAHEFAHHLHGHVDYYNQHSALNALAEISISKSNTTAIDPLINQIVEWDADRVAMSFLSGMSISLLRNVPEMLERHSISSWQEMLTATSFAVSTVCHFFDDARKKDDSYTLALYPSWEMREYSLNWVGWASYFRYFHEESLEQIQGITAVAVANSELAFNKFKGHLPYTSLEKLFTVQSDQFQEHLQRILSGWPNLRKELLPHALCLLPD